MKNKLAMLRKEKGLTQMQLGKALGVSRQTIIAIEGERFDPSLPLAFAIARYFERQIEDIFLDGAE